MKRVWKSILSIVFVLSVISSAISLSEDSIEIRNRTMRISKVDTSQFYSAIATAYLSNSGMPANVEMKLTLYDAQGNEIQQDHDRIFLPSGWSEIWSLRSDISKKLYPRYNRYSIEIASITPVETDVSRCFLKHEYELKDTDPVIVYYEVSNNTDLIISPGDIKIYLVYVGDDGSSIYSQTITAPTESPVFPQETLTFAYSEDEELSNYMREYGLKGLFSLAYFDQII